MNKNIPILFAALAGSLSLGAFPLEWNTSRPTGIPYEVDINRSKLEKLAGIEKNCGFEITAETPEGKKKLDVTLLSGSKPESVAVRFIVPEGTTALDCQPVSAGSISDADTVNLFAGTLADASAWKATNGGTIKAADNKMCFAANRFGETIFSCTVNVPAEAAGTGAKFEFDFKSTAKETWASTINVEQLDANGKVLSESLTDPRWITLMRPYQVVTPHREVGRFHPKAAKLRLVIRARGVNHPIGADGLRAKNPKAFLPSFEISFLTARAVEELPFPKYRDEFFSAGISGKTGDFALDTTKGKSVKGFFFATHSQASWAESKVITDVNEKFYPVADGTAEVWIKPAWKKRENRNTFFYIFTAEAPRVVGPMADLNIADAKKKAVPCLGLKYYPRQKKAVVEFKDYTLKIYQKEFTCDIPEKKWNHVAVQWQQNDGMQVFINGKKVLDDKTFTYTPADYSLPEILNAKERYTPTANEFIPSQFTLGNTRARARAGVFTLKAEFDLLRISSGKRYDGDFTPAKKFTMDKDTRALFDFDRSFDGKTYGGIKFISGTNWADVSRVENTIQVNGKNIDYIPPAILDSNNPEKVLDKRNYTRVPNAKDFLAARKSEKVVFDFKENTQKTITLPDNVYMDYIEYKNTGNTTAVHPFIRRDSEIDPRSFADIRNSMNINKSTPRERTNRIFQFMLSSSDYYASHQLYFEPGTDVPENACYKALTMLNSYCGFECGPLNNMAANMLTCSGDIPASQTAGFGHSFQQACVDGKSNLYDLSAQRFYPSMDNENPAGLGETEIEPGIFNRAGGGSDSYIRLGTRGYTAQTPAYTERVAMSLRPGETLRMWFINNGRFNNLQYNPYLKKYNKTMPDLSKAVHAAKTRRHTPVIEIRRIFPHYGSTFLYFNDTPAKFAKSFTNVKADSFCYNVVACYPVVYAEYAAKLKNGGFAKLEISTDRGKTFRPLTVDKDGTARPYYPVCGRREYLIRIKAPLKNVANFNAMTQMITNPRVMTGKLAKGENTLLYTVQNKSDVKVTMQYRKNVKDIKISGELIRTGSERGFERIVTALAPGESKTFDVKGISGSAKVKTTGKLKAKLAGNKLTVSAPAGNIKTIEAATITDDGAEKQLVVLIHNGIELVTAKNITPVKQSELVTNEIQQSVNIKGRGAQVKVNFTKTHPAGTYAVWNCIRLSNQMNWSRVNVRLPQGGEEEVFRHLNAASEFLKSKFFGENGRGKFFWTFRNEHYYENVNQKLGKPFSSLTYTVPISSEKYIELAGTLILPAPTTAYYDEMVKTLCGINHNKWYVDENNAKK